MSPALDLDLELIEVTEDNQDGTVPGEDIFYFFQQARDDYLSPQRALTGITPPTTNTTLLSSSYLSNLLSRSMLPLIASTFAQMCAAVVTCHAGCWVFS